MFVSCVFCSPQQFGLKEMVKKGKKPNLGQHVRRRQRRQMTEFRETHSRVVPKITTEVS